MVSPSGLADSRRYPLICSPGGKTCGACCSGPLVSRESLTRRLRRHKALFKHHLSSRDLPGAWSLLWHELRARTGLDLIWAPLLRLPFVSERLRGWLATRVVCSFLAFRDEAEQQVGCLLHPASWARRDVRGRAAFRLLRDVGCGASDYFCAGGATLHVRLPGRSGELSRPRA